MLLSKNAVRPRHRTGNRTANPMENHVENASHASINRQSGRGEEEKRMGTKCTNTRQVTMSQSLAQHAIIYIKGSGARKMPLHDGEYGRGGNVYQGFGRARRVGWLRCHALLEMP